MSLKKIKVFLRVNLMKIESNFIKKYRKTSRITGNIETIGLHRFF
jgi:hypothetical protein